MRYWLLSLLVVALLGCGGEVETPKKSTKTKTKKSSASKTEVAAKPKEPPPTPKVDPNAYSSVTAALEAYLAAVDKDDQETMATANNWLVARGSTAVAPLSKVLSDNSATPQQRIVACKILAQLPGTKDVLIEATGSEQKQLRVNAIQALGRVKPVDKQVIDKLMELAKGKDEEVQRYAVSSLGKLGPAAKDAVPLVQSMLNDKAYNETVRAEARKTLKAIDPRKGLMGISGENGK